MDLCAYFPTFWRLALNHPLTGYSIRGYYAVYLVPRDARDTRSCVGRDRGTFCARAVGLYGRYVMRVNKTFGFCTGSMDWKRLRHGD